VVQPSSSRGTGFAGPREAVSVQFDYKINAQGIIEQTQIDDNDRRAELVSENFRWAATKWEDMFGVPA
jgi:hypothetical protein